MIWTSDFSDLWWKKGGEEEESKNEFELKEGTITRIKPSRAHEPKKKKKKKRIQEESKEGKGEIFRHKQAPTNLLSTFSANQSAQLISV